MTALFSILALFAAWAILANVERLPWPPQRETAIHDVQYWQTVLNDSKAYLSLHSGVVGETRRNVEAMAQAAQEIVTLLDSYTEISPSKRGLRIFVEADLGDFAGRRRGNLELYSFGRYLTITGDRVPDSSNTIEPRLQELRALYKRFLAENKPSIPQKNVDRSPKSETIEDTEVLKRMFEGKLGMLYRDIYMGDIRNVHGQDESRADTLLFNGLAYYTKGNAEQMRRILTSSPRYNQRGAKWHKRVSGDTTYLDYQIEDSISYSQKR